MKTERRHELATNELADWIVHFPQWFKDNQTTIIVGAVVVAGLIAYTIFYYSRQSNIVEEKQAIATVLLEQLDYEKDTVIEGKAEGLGVSDIFLNTAGSLQNAAEETDNPLMAALDMIKRAEALRTELHYRPKPAELDVRKNQLQQARDIYQQALEKAKGNPDISAMAEYGTVLSLEDMGDFEGAQKLYEKIADTAEYKGSSYAARAKFRQKVLSDYKEKVFFAQALKPVEQPVEPNARPIPAPLDLESPSTDINKTIQDDLEINLPTQ
ncbi:MAG: hypothetical protein ABSE89_06910 [Sedimentisphaerales bacterium]